MKKLIKLFTLLVFLCGSFCLTTISYAQENSEGEEPITMEIQPGTSITLLPGQQFNAAIKTLANNGEAVSYGTVDNNIQNFQRAEEIPAGANTGIISEDGSYLVYAWFDGGTLYYASQSETIYLNENSQQMFFNFNGIEELDLSDFDTSNVTNMGGVFAGCSSLEEINLSGWDFSKYNMSSLMMNMTYGGLPSLKKLDMSNTKYGTTMNYAFGGLSTLEEIILEGADTSVVTNMGAMFNGDSKLTELNLGGRNTSNVNNMGGIFGGCSSLAEINLDGIDTSNVTNMSGMFYGCIGLTGLDLSNFDTSNVTNMGGVFAGCSSLEEINLSGWDFSKYNMSSLMMNMTYGGLPSLKKLDMSNTKYGTTMNYAFGGLSTLEEIVLEGADTSVVTNMGAMFNGDSKLLELNLGGRNTSNVTDMGAMFYNCSNLTGLDLSSFNTSNVTSMSNMFGGCSSLAEINLSGWDFRKYNTAWLMMNMTAGGFPSLKKLDMTNTKYNTSMQNAFAGLTGLQEINLDGIDTSNVTNMSGMFYECIGLTGLDLSNFDTSNVTNMFGMFGVSSATAYKYGGSKLEELNLSGWDFRKAGSDMLISKIFGFTNYYSDKPVKKLNLTNAKFSGSMRYALSDCSKLSEIKLEGVDTSGVTDMSDMFHMDAVLTGLDLSSFDTSNVTKMRAMFNGCRDLEEVSFSGWDFRQVNDCNDSYGFIGGLFLTFKSGIKKIDLTNAKFSGSIAGAFNHFYNLEELELDNVDTSEVTNMSQMFYYCKKLKSLDLSSFETNNVTNMSQMFGYCSGISNLDLSNFNTNNVTNMNEIFDGCDGLEQLNLSGWDFRKAGSNSWSSKLRLGQSYGVNKLRRLNLTNTKFSGSMYNAFYDLKVSEEIKFDGIDTSNVTDMTNTFSNFKGIKDLDLSDFDTSNVKDMTYMFGRNNGLETINFDGWNTSNVTAMSAMFRDCSGLNELDLSNFDTSNVTKMREMFYNTPTLKTIYVSDKFVTTNVTDNGGGMFYGTVSVVGGNGTKFDPNFIGKTYALIDKVGQTGYFTDKNAITVKFINNLDGTETISTFSKGQKLTPPTVNGYHVVGGYTDEAMTQKIDLNNGVDSYSIIYVKYERNGSSGGGGGGGGGGSSKPDTLKQDEQKPTETPQDDSIVSSGTNARPAELGENPESETPMDSSEQAPQNDAQEINNSPANNASEGQNQQKYSTEFQQAYEFAKGNGITTMSTIQKADMNGKLTRIQMAKMLSQYAINVLGMEPDISKGIADFSDVTRKMNKDYDNGVTLAYQLGIMGQNMPNNKFRPNDEVSRAEFVTALSRLLYSTSDGKYESTPQYYVNHMEKLKGEGIITKADPKMKELRGYVMIMLMRSAK